jgi:hypothetical protein
MTQQPAKSQEPSMEEILASIRRIIADDDASKSAARPPEPLKALARAPALPRSSPPAPGANAGHGETSAGLNGTGGVEEQSSSRGALNDKHKLGFAPVRNPCGIGLLYCCRP